WWPGEERAKEVGCASSRLLYGFLKVMVTSPVRGAGWSWPVASAAAGRVVGGAADVLFVAATELVVVGFTSPTTVLSVLVSGAVGALLPVTAAVTDWPS